MFAALPGLTALRARFVGPPLDGVKLVVPLASFVAGPSARIEIGLDGGLFAFRLVVPALRPAPFVDLDADFGLHDAWAKF
ncbi:MAG TPA: hypothetical protein VGB53_16955 [Rubricoccaceae bacterium]|jgi:hypothetical protein